MKNYENGNSKLVEIRIYTYRDKKRVNKNLTL